MPNTDKKMLSLSELQRDYGLNSNTIKRERYEMKAVKEKKLKEEDVKNASGFGYTTIAYPMYGKLFYKREDVEKFIEQHREASPQERLENS